MSGVVGAVIEGVTKLVEGGACPPESGGQHDRDISRDRARGGSKANLVRNTVLEPPLAASRKTCDAAALLTQEGKSHATNLFTLCMTARFYGNQRIGAVTDRA